MAAEEGKGRGKRMTFPLTYGKIRMRGKEGEGEGRGRKKKMRLVSAFSCFRFHSGAASLWDGAAIRRHAAQGFFLFWPDTLWLCGFSALSHRAADDAPAGTVPAASDTQGKAAFVRKAMFIGGPISAALLAA